MTTAQQLDDYAERLFTDATVWTPDLQTELMDMIRGPAAALGQVIPPNDRTKAIDNIYRCKPKGWISAAQELRPNAAGQPSAGAVASYMLWDLSPGAANFGLTGNHEIGTLHVYKTLALAMLAALARTWAEIIRENGL